MAADKEYQTGRCLLGMGLQSAARSRWLADAVAVEIGSGARMLGTCDAEDPFGAALTTVGRLFGPLVEQARSEAPELLRRYAPELLQIWPALRDDALFVDTVYLESIALGGTKRRLHCDSEQLFRIVHGLASFVEGMLARVAPAEPGLFVCDNLDAADRLSIAALVHMLHRLSGRVVLIATSETEWLYEPSSLGRPWVWGEEELIGRARRAKGDAFVEHAALFRNIVTLSGTAVHDVDATDLPAITGTDSTAVRLAALGADRDTIGRLIKVAELPDGIEYGRMTRRRRRAVIAAMSPAERQTLHNAIFAALTPRPEPAELHFGRKAHHALLAGKVREGLVAALQALDAGFGFSMNFEFMLACADEALSQAEGDAALALGLMRTLVIQYVGQVERSGAELAALYDLSPPGVLRAQIAFYHGLTLSKRLGQIDEALERFELGCAEFMDNSITDWRAALEYGWLCNGSAFCLWQKGETEKAHVAVRAALAAIEPFSHPQIINLMVNLLNNLSVLHETAKDFSAALDVWRSLDSLNQVVGGGRFSKSYHYRQGWLLLQIGDPAKALACYERSHQIADEVGDIFHRDIISRACGYASILCGDFARAEKWYRLNLELREKLGDRVNIAYSWAVLGWVAEIRGDANEARRMAHCSMTLAKAHRRTALATSAARHIDTIGRRSKDAALEDGLAGNVAGFDRPKMKLTTPFAIAHLAHGMHAPAMHLTLSPVD